ncbi:MAG: hypothetical protein HY326_09980 [Chloroflexi bacterium]|nr:hypothetical protein [Chloroflexota bacterium]
MPPETLPPEIRVFVDPVSSIIIFVISLGIFILTLAWAWRRENIQRRRVFIAGLLSALILFLIDVIAINANWWSGALQAVPILSLLSVCVLLGTGGFVLWLGLYRWLEVHTRRPLLVYAGIVLIFIPIVLLVDPIQINRGEFIFSGGYTLWTDVLLGQIVMWIPVLLYEGTSRIWLPGTSTHHVRETYRPHN